MGLLDDMLQGVPGTDKMGLLAKLLAAGGTAGIPPIKPDAGDDASGKIDNIQPRPPQPTMTMEANGKGVDAPPSTNDPMAAEPTLFSGGVPLPRPRPTDSINAPLSLAPQQDAALPPNASPTVGQGAPAAPQAASSGPGGILSGIGDTLGGLAKGAFNKLTDPNTAATRLALASGFAGAPSFGTGMSRAFGAAVPAMQQDRAFALKQEGITQTFKALRQLPGMTDPVAMAMALNPELMKSMGPEYMGGNKVEKVKDVTGQERLVLVNAAKGTQIPLTGGQTGGGGPGNIDPQVWNKMTPEQRLEKMPPEVQGELRAIYEGRQSGTGRNVQQLLPMLNQVWPDFTMQDYQTKQKTRNNYTSGPGGQEIKAVNTAIYHASKLQAVSDKMGGFDTAPALLNPVTNAIKNQFPQVAPGFQDAKKTWDTTAETLASEVSKALNGGNVHVADKEHWRSILQGADGPEQRKAAITAVMGILEGRTHAAAANYNQGMGTMRDPISFIDPANRDTFNHLMGTSVEPQAGAAATAPTQPGAAQGPAPVPPVANRQVGVTYMTPRGPAIWRGTGWELPR